MDNDSLLTEEENIDFSADLVTLTDEEGEEHTFELVDTLDKNGERYVALITVCELPEDILEDDGNFTIMKIVDEDGEEILELIEDDDEFEEISEIFMERLSDLYEFDEDGDFDDEDDDYDQDD